MANALAWYWTLRGRFTEADRWLGTALRRHPDPTDPACLRAAAWRWGVRRLCGGGGGSSGVATDDRRPTESADPNWAPISTALPGPTSDSDPLPALDPDVLLDLTANPDPAVLPIPLPASDLPALPDPAGLDARTVWFLGHVLTETVEYETSSRLIDQALTMFRTSGDAWGIAAALSIRAIHHFGAASWERPSLYGRRPGRRCPQANAPTWTASRTRHDKPSETTATPSKSNTDAASPRTGSRPDDRSPRPSSRRSTPSRHRATPPDGPIESPFPQSPTNPQHHGGQLCAVSVYGSLVLAYPRRSGVHMGGFHHVELWVPDLAAARRSWGWLLTELGWTPYQDWDGGCSWRLADAYLVMECSSAMTRCGHNRLRPGLNHLAFHAEDTATVDRLVADGPAHGWELLYADRHPYAGGPEHYAAYLSDQDGFEAELVASKHLD